MKLFAPFVILLFLVATLALSQEKSPTNPNDPRLVAARTFIETARTYGRTHPAPTDRFVVDSYEAVKSQIALDDPQESLVDETIRVSHLKNLAQGFCEVERNPRLKGYPVRYDLALDPSDPTAVVVSYYYPPETVRGSSLKGLRWRVHLKSPSKTEGYKLLRVEQQVLSNVPANLAGIVNITPELND
jgi:hypothetical protein